MHQLAATVASFKRMLEPVQGRLYFATMANDRDRVLEAMSSHGLGACVNSIPHMEMALSRGFAPERVQFTSTAISRADMTILHRRRIRTNLDSLGQLQSWFNLGAREAGLRVNAGSLLGRSDGDRIGIAAQEVPAAIRLAGACGTSISGLHVYVGTNFQSPDQMAPTLQAFFELARDVPELGYVNVGGGIGIDYAGEGRVFDLDAYGALLTDLLVRLRASTGRDIELILEPGRGLTAPCGAFIAEIIDIKRLNDTTYIGVDASIAIFPRPFHNPEQLHEVLFPGHEGSRRGPADAVIVGRTTFSKDVLGRARAPDELRPGDLVVMENAGAYLQSMTSCFLGQPAPAEVYLIEREQLLVAAE